MKNRKFLIKLVLTYGVVVLIYTVVATGVYFQKSNEMRIEQLSSSQKEFVLQVRDKIDTQMTVALNLVQQLKWNERLLQFNREEERDYYNTTRFHSDLQMMANSFSNYGMIIGVQKLSDDFIVSSRGTSTTPYYFEDLNMDDNNILIFNNYLANHEAMEPLLLHNDSMGRGSGKFFTLVKKEDITGGEKMVFYISFPNEAVNLTLPEQEQRGFAVSVGNRVISMSSNDQDAAKALSFLHTLDLEASHGYSNMQQGDFMLHIVHSEVLPETQYIYLTHSDGVQEQLNGLMRESLLIFVALTLTGAVIIGLISIYTYRPYSRIIQANEALLEITEQSKLSLKQSFLRDVMFGRLTKGQIQNGLQAASIDSMRMPASVVILELMNYKEWAEQLSSDGIRKSIGQLQILIREHLAGVEHELLEVDFMRFPIIVFGLEPEQLESLIVRLTSSIEKGSGLGLEWTAVIGKSVTKLEQLYDSYQEALNLLEFRYARTNNTVITKDQLGHVVDADYYYPLDVEKELILYIVSGNQTQANDLIDKLISENLEKRDLSNEEIFQFLFAITATVNRIMRQMNWKKDDVFDEGYQIYSDLVGFESKLQLRQKITDLFLVLISHHQEKQSVETVKADALLDYIHETVD